MNRVVIPVGQEEGRKQRLRLMDMLEKLQENNVRVRSKVWLELHGKPFFGEGRYKILQAIDRYGSILRASEEIEVPYRKIRGAIYAMEQAIGKEMVVRFRGGREGGRAEITESARELMKLFKQQDKGIREIVDELYEKTFC